MNNWISKVAIGAALAAASTASMGMDSNFFVNGEVAGSDINISNLQDRDNTSTAGALRFGYMWQQGPVAWGVETGYVDLGSISGNGSQMYIGNGLYDSAHVSIRTHGEMLGGNFKLYINDYGWYLSSRTGWFHSQTDQRFSDSLHLLQTQTTSADGNGAYVGLGIGYDFNKHMGVSLNYDAFRTSANGIYAGRFNTSMYGGTFEYRF